MLNTKIANILHEINQASPPSSLVNIAVALSKAIDANYLIISQVNAEKTLLNPVTAIHNNQSIDYSPFSLINSPCAEAISSNDPLICDDIQKRFPENKDLKRLKAKCFIGIPLTNGRESDAIIVALFSDTIGDAQAIIDLVSLFSGIITKELKYQQHQELVTIPSEIISESTTPQVVCNQDKIIIYVNDAFCSISGYSRLELINHDISMFKVNTYIKNHSRSIVNDLAEQQKWSGEFTFQIKNNSFLTKWLKINVIADEKKIQKRYILQVHDLKTYSHNNLTFFPQAMIDELTNLPNKHVLLENIDLKLNSISDTSSSSKSALLLFDIDSFRNINTTFGRKIGDSLLIKIAEQVKFFSRTGYTFSRVSNDSFAVFIPNVNSISQINNYANKITKIFDLPFLIEHFSIHCSISMGVSLSSPTDENAFRLLNKAEQAKAIAKEHSNNKYFYFNQHIENKYIRQVTLQEKLHNAIKNDQIEVFYQPIICMKSNTVRKFEALVRWQHHDEWISPVEFIPIAEKHGLIKQIGNMVLKKSCLFLQHLKQQGFNDIVFSLNRSVHELPNKKAEQESWLNTIYEHALTPTDICFELTESTLASEFKGHFLFLDSLRSCGCQIALDDFGTGYSSLSYLRKLNIDLLKIDRSFVSEMVENKADRDLVKAILIIAQNLDIDVIAEGAETEEQVNLLNQLGCDFIQGYYFSKPLPKTEVLSYLETFNPMIL